MVETFYCFYDNSQLKTSFLRQDTEKNKKNSLMNRVQKNLFKQLIYMNLSLIQDQAQLSSSKYQIKPFHGSLNIS